MTSLNGYNGKVARVDLSGRKVTEEDLDPAVAEKFIGGVGLAARLTHDMLSSDDYAALRADPLDPCNPLIFSTGPLTGTATPSSSRYAVTGISPLTGIWGESTSGGFFPVALKHSGFDAIIITGESSEPVHLSIIDGKMTIEDAAALWGKNTRETASMLKEASGDSRTRVACIGKAGEQMVHYAAIINDEGRAAGRCGLGTVMGKKRLKAVAVRGNQKVPYQDKARLAEVAGNASRNMQGNFATQFFSHYGTLCYTDMGMVLGDVPSKYFTSSEFVAETFTGLSLRERFPVTKYACAGCKIGCGHATHVEIDGEEVAVDGPEYETVASFGPLCGVEEFDPVVRANHQCNLDGIDTISSGVCIAFLIYLAENNLARDEIAERLRGSSIDVDHLRWGNAPVVLQLLDMTIQREGVGDLLALGVRRMARELNVDPGLAAHVKGLEIPMHDPRAYAGQALTYMTACCGANHEKGDFFNIDGDAASIPKVKKGDRFSIAGREGAVAIYQDIANIYDSCVVCNFPHLIPSSLGTMLVAATGFKSLGKGKLLLQAGERATNVKRLISCNLGITAQDDVLPRIVTEPLASGGTAGVKLELHECLKRYYEARGWDENGIPTKETLDSLL